MADAQDIENNPTIRKLKDWDPHAITEAILFRGELTLLIPREHLIHVAEFVRSDAELRFTFLSDITAVDRFPIEPRFELNYHVLSIERRERLRLKIRVQGKDPVVPSVTSVWPTANWHEREAFDLFGVRFEGHPLLQRILMPDDWEGYPLRKDYPVEGYR